MVKAHAFDQLALEFRRGARAQSDGGGVARHQEDHGIHRQHDHKQDQHGEEYALDRVIQHGLIWPPLYGDGDYTMSRLILSCHLRSKLPHAVFLNFKFHLDNEVFCVAGHGAAAVMDDGCIFARQLNAEIGDDLCGQGITIDDFIAGEAFRVWVWPMSGISFFGSSAGSPRSSVHSANRESPCGDAMISTG